MRTPIAYPDLPETARVFSDADLTWPDDRGPTLEDFISVTPKEEPKIDTSGWTDLGGQARKFHYFPEAVPSTRSFCGKWMLSPFINAAKVQYWNLQPDEGQTTPGDCAACTRKLGR